MEITDNEVKQMKAVREDVSTAIPAGYITIELSSHGKLGAPAKFHIRNFLTEDLTTLALTDDDEMQVKIAEMLQDLILEPKEQCDILKFHEKEVVETLLILYKSFYASNLMNLDWELTDDDKKQLAAMEGGIGSAQYNAHIRAIENREEVKHFDINLNAVEFYELDDNFKSTAHCKKSNGFSCVYSFPRYGDVILLKKFLENMPEWKDGDKQFASIKNNLKFKQQMEERWKKGENVPLERLPYFPDAEIKKFNDYQTRKAAFATKAIRALHLIELDGKDISNLPLEQRIELASNPQLDHTTFEKVSELYANMKVGPKEDLKAMDPYLNKVVTIKYSFRLLTIFQALQHSTDNGTTITFE